MIGERGAGKTSFKNGIFKLLNMPNFDEIASDRDHVTTKFTSTKLY